ncbi:hypothetical protein CMUS01_16134 [Colletotrichum musicola]|uniref:Uncharacterized protein n=1 Tax=Colletotrichum musicola TaxID=2175873 RepID=A0A8H6MJS0_9PEZI|nr:hypothetical protein CMUS01_16134 [Colletotrichum musicola]
MTRLREEDERQPPPTLPERQNTSWNTSTEETETPLEDKTVPPTPLSEDTDLPKNDKTHRRFHQIPNKIKIVIRSHFESDKNLKEYDMALFNPGPTFKSVYNQLRSTVSISMISNTPQHFSAKPKGTSGSRDQYWTDRSYITPRHKQRRDRDNQGLLQHGHFDQQSQQGPKPTKRYYVYREAGY